MIRGVGGDVHNEFSLLHEREGGDVYTLYPASMARFSWALAASSALAITAAFHAIFSSLLQLFQLAVGFSVVTFVAVACGVRELMVG